MAQFEDPFAGTPKAAIKRELGVDNSTPILRLWKKHEEV